jgi:hypothetical protein
MLQNRLITLMRREINSRKLQPSPYCVKQIEGLIRQGIVRMQTMNADKNPGHVMKAEQNIKGLVAFLAEHARKARTFPTLGENEYDAAMRNPPALWPFCSAG